MRDGYSFKSENNGCSIYMSNIFYGHAPLKSGLFLLNLDSSDTHIHNIEAKRCRVDNDSATYLWHCRLGHIGVKRMKKLHTDGLLEPLVFVILPMRHGSQASSDSKSLSAWSFFMHFTPI